MKNRICLMVFIVILTVSCKKEFRPQTAEQVVVQMKNDIEMKELYNASKGWVIMTSIDVGKRRFDSSATVAYLQNFKSIEQDRLFMLVENIKLKYKFHLYTVERKKEIITETFRYFMIVETDQIQKQRAGAKFEEPVRPDDISVPFVPRDCYKWLIEDVSDCDKEMVIDSGLSLFGLVTGPLTYFVAQAGAFIKHSLCVDNAHEAYRRCMSKTLVYDNTETSNIGDGIFQIRNPENPSDFIIIYQGPE